MFFHLSKGRAAPEHVTVPQRSATGAFRAGNADSAFFVDVFSMEDGPMFDPYKIPGSRSLHERKLATWALLVGETRSSAVHAEVRRRPHRGMLPDVDFSQAVPDLSRPSLVRRLIRMIRPDGGQGATTADKAVGETVAPAYIGRDRQASPDDSSGEAYLHARAA